MTSIVTTKARNPLDGGSNVDVSTPAEIEQELMYRSSQLDEALEELRDCQNKADVSSFEYEKKYAFAHMATDSDLTVGIRESMAKAATMTEKFDAKIRDGLLRSAKAALEVREKQLNAAQTRAALLKAQMGLDGGRR